MTDYYINTKKRIENKNKMKENFFFGLCLGIIIISISFIKYITTLSTQNDKLYLFISTIGLIIIIFSIIYPNILSYVKKLFYIVANFVGKLISYIILTIIFFLFVCPAGIFIRKKYTIHYKDSTLTTYHYDNEGINVNKNSFIYRFAKIIRFFYNEKYFILIPVLIVLIILSTILIFLQSSTIAPFIYTLF